MASVGENEFLVQAAIYLGATAVAVPVFKKLKLGTILGFLAAGLVLGPSGLGLLEREEGVFHVAELGVVLFLFVIGLELSLGRLWNLKRTIFGLGLMQMAITGALLGLFLDRMGILSTAPAYLAGFALACSSTAFVLSLLQERRELNTPYGTKSFSILLFQDLAVIPLLAAIPLVAMIEGGNSDDLAIEWTGIAAAGAAIVAVILLGRFALNPFFRLVAAAGSREAFTAAALFVVAGVSLIVAEAGLSMALGAFIAGVLLAESSFRHQIEADIEPFRELLLGLFFIGVGMQLDLSVVAAQWWIVIAGTLALMVFKGAIIWLLSRLFGAREREPFRIAAILCQGGEFGFVVFSLGAGRGVFSSEFATIASAIITLSMMATPLVVIAASRMKEKAASLEGAHLPDGLKGDVILVGFGRFGQIISGVLNGAQVSVTAVDMDPKRIQTARRFGHKVYYGNGTDVNLLIQAGVLSANAIVFAVKETEEVAKAVAAVRARCPKIKIAVRAYDRIAAIELMDSDIDVIVRDTLESALVTAQHTLGFMGISDGLARDLVAEFRERDRDWLLEQKAKGFDAIAGRMNDPLDAARRDETSATAPLGLEAPPQPGDARKDAGAKEKA